MTEPARRIIHDVNNQLMVIRGYTDLAARDLDPADPAYDHLERIKRAADDIAGLMDQLKGAPAVERTPPRHEPHSDARVLVVDDSQTIRRLTTYALEAAGFEVLAADGAEQARARLADDEVDLLLADVQMPGTSGPELAAEARRLRPSLPIVFVTGDGAGAIEFDGGTAPALAKPFVASELVRAVRSALGERE